MTKTVSEKYVEDFREGERCRGLDAFGEKEDGVYGLIIYVEVGNGGKRWKKMEISVKDGVY